MRPGLGSEWGFAIKRKSDILSYGVSHLSKVRTLLRRLGEPFKEKGVVEKWTSEEGTT